MFISQFANKCQHGYFLYIVGNYICIFQFLQNLGIGSMYTTVQAYSMTMLSINMGVMFMFHIFWGITCAAYVGLTEAF